MLSLFGDIRTNPEDLLKRLSSKQVGLLIVLAAKPNGLDRREAASLLWPASGQRSGRHSLNQALYRIRQVLGPSAVTSVGNRLVIDRLPTDIHEFRTAIQNGDSDRAALLYRGDVATGFSISDSVEFEHRLDSIRAQYRSEAEGLLTEPLSSSVLSELRGVLLCDASPSDQGLGPPIRREVFVGRSYELQELDRVWKEVRHGQFRSVLIIGEPGIGKSALCRRFLRKTVLEGSRVCAGAGFELEANLALGVVRQVLEDSRASSYSSELSPLLTRLLDFGGASPPDGPPGSLTTEQIFGEDTLSMSNLASEVGRHLTEISAEIPLVLFVDDLQWVDPASVAIFHHLCRSLSGGKQRILFLISVRAGGSLRGEWPETERMEITGLAEEEIHYLCSSMQSESPIGLSWDDVAVLTRGNPLMVRSILEANTLPDDLPPTAHTLLLAEVETLSHNPRAVGTALAVAGPSLDRHSIAALTGLSPPAVDSGLAVLERRGFILIDCEIEACSLRHHAIGSLFLEVMTPVDRARLHGRAAELLTRQGRSPAVIADQFAIAGSKSEAYAAAMSAAVAANKLHAVTETEHFYRVALAHASTPAEVMSVAQPLVFLLLDQSRPAIAKDVIEAMKAKEAFTPTQAAELDALEILSDFVLRPRSLDFARRATRTLGRLSRHIPAPLHVRCLTEIAISAVETGQGEAALAAIDAGLRSLAKLGDPADEVGSRALFYALSALTGCRRDIEYPFDDLMQRAKGIPSAEVRTLVGGAAIELINGRPNRAEELLLRAMSLAERFVLPDLKVGVNNNLGVVYLEQGRWEEAASLLTYAIEFMEFGSKRQIISAVPNLGILYWETGQLMAAAEIGLRCLGLAAQTGSLRADYFGRGVLGLVALEEGKLASAREYERELRAALPVRRWWGNDLSYPEIFLARMASLSGHREEAITRLRTQIEYSAEADLLSAARMEIELLGMLVDESPAEARSRALELRETLAVGGAKPLVERLDGVVARCDLRLG